MDKPINIIFDGPPGPEAGRFVEVETDDGQSVSAGQWIDREDGTWALRITALPEVTGDALLECPKCGSYIVDGQCTDVGDNHCGYTTE